MPSTDTWRSCIASSSALWVRGVARLISSTSRRFVNTGPSTKRRPVGSNRLAPVTSDGSRSGVPWTRAVPRSRLRAIARASSVLPVPGTSSSSTWPSASRAIATRRTVSSAPTTARATDVRRSSHSRRPAVTTSPPGVRISTSTGCGSSSTPAGSIIRRSGSRHSLPVERGWSSFRRPARPRPGLRVESSAASSLPPEVHPCRCRHSPASPPRLTRSSAWPMRIAPTRAPGRSTCRRACSSTRRARRRSSTPSSRPSDAWRPPPAPSSTGRSTASSPTGSSYGRWSSARTTRP